MRVPGINYHDRTSMEVTLAVYQLAVEALEKELRRDTRAEPCPLIECGAARAVAPCEPHEAAITQITEALKRMGAK